MPYCIVPDHHRHSNDQSSAENGGSGAAESGGNGGGNDGAGEKVRLFYETYGHGDTKVLMIMGVASGHAAWQIPRPRLWARCVAIPGEGSGWRGYSYQQGLTFDESTRKSMRVFPAAGEGVYCQYDGINQPDLSLLPSLSLFPSLPGLASGHAAWRFQVKALVGTGVPNGLASGHAAWRYQMNALAGHRCLASGHAAWRYQVKALAGTGVPNGGGRHKESIFESSGLERRDTGEGTGIPNGGRRQEGAEEKGEKGEEGNDEEKERGGDEEFGNGERCCNGSRDGKGGGRMEGEGVERGVGDGCEGEKKLRERQGGEEREEVERGEEARGAEEKREGGRGGGSRSGIEVCIFDNRGVGHSSCPSDPTQYTEGGREVVCVSDNRGVGHSSCPSDPTQYTEVGREVVCVSDNRGVGHSSCPSDPTQYTEVGREVVCVSDNRGVGHSSCPSNPTQYTEGGREVVCVSDNRGVGHTQLMPHRSHPVHVSALCAVLVVRSLEETQRGSSRSGIEVCIFGNRGVGHSSCPSDPTQYTTPRRRWQQMHCGMIACKVAAAASHRIISLALISVSGGGFDLLPRLDSRVFSIVYRLLNARTPELRAQVDLDTHFSQEYMEETEASSGMSRREALHMEYVRELSAPSAMQTPHGANGHLNACWTHSLTPHDVDEICSAHIPTAVIHGRDDVIAHISLGERVARSLGRVARFLPLMGAHMVLRERAHEVNACLAVLMEVAERRVPVEEWVESYRDDRLPVPATWQNEIGRSSSQDFTNPFFQFPSQWFQPEMWTLFSRTWV
ncbi:unnamed protein product [Closterium sp. Naga37s-1]|nr:unnamed protein product [Closterium sp. Naga37s-1]